MGGTNEEEPDDVGVLCWAVQPSRGRHPDTGSLLRHLAGLRLRNIQAMAPSKSRESGAVRKNSPAYTVPALSKAVAVLDLLASDADGLTVTEIVERLDRSMGELYRIIVALERLGLIARDERNDRYFLTLKLFEMSHRHPPIERLVHSAMPILRRLAEQSDQSAHLGAVDGDRLIALATADSPQKMRYSIRLGAAFRALDTSSGVVIIAHSDRQVQEHHVQSLPRGQRAEMRERFKQAVMLGFEQRKSAVVRGVVNLSCPVFDHAGIPQAAVTIPYLEHLETRIGIEPALELVIAAARELSQSLGWTADRRPPAGGAP